MFSAGSDRATPARTKSATGSASSTHRANFMDYVDDVCMDTFTVDQTERVRTHWHAFRDKETRRQDIEPATARLGDSV
jgi:hypothetical protein